jgi:predicted nucleic acid-binding protein
MAFVLDASVALSWCFQDEADPVADQIQDRMVEERGVVPTLWRYEMAKALAVAHRRGRIDDEELASIEVLLGGMNIEEAPACGIAELARVAGEHRLTAYDAAYLQVAAARRLPLATLDATLAEAARSAGVALLR